MEALLFFSPLLIGTFPLWATARWFMAALLLYIVANLMLFGWVAASLGPSPDQGGDGPALLGLAMYFVASLMLCAVSMAVRWLAVRMLRQLDNRPGKVRGL